VMRCLKLLFHLTWITGTCISALPIGMQGLICFSGYICVTGANVSTPSDGRTGYVCPMGQYCPAGSLVPLPCPKGSYNHRTKLRDVKECRQCRGGHYCQVKNMTSPGPPCLEGKYHLF
jgi:hypothetical protein